MKKTVIIRNIALALFAVLLLHFSARYLGLVLSPKFEEGEGENYTLTKDLASFYFFTEKASEIDEVFIGSSHVYCGIDVNILNREYGKKAILLATTAQPLELSYYAVMAAYETKRPKTIYLETYFAISDNQDQKPLSSRALLDDMPNWTRAKYEASKLSGNPMYYYYYPITDLHSTWWKIRAQDFLPKKLENGERFGYYSYQINPMESWELIDEDETAPIPETAEHWLQMICDFCREKGIELVLYTIPYPAGAESQAIYHSLSGFAEKNGVEYYDLFECSKIMGINAGTDFKDDHHLNSYGQEKLTRYMAEYIMK